MHIYPFSLAPFSGQKAIQQLCLVTTREIRQECQLLHKLSEAGTHSFQFELCDREYIALTRMFSTTQDSGSKIIYLMNKKRADDKKCRDTKKREKNRR